MIIRVKCWNLTNWSAVKSGHFLILIMRSYQWGIAIHRIGCQIYFVLTFYKVAPFYNFIKQNGIPGRRSWTSDTRVWLFHATVTKYATYEETRRSVHFALDMYKKYVGEILDENIEDITMSGKRTWERFVNDNEGEQMKSEKI